MHFIRSKKVSEAAGKGLLMIALLSLCAAGGVTAEKQASRQALLPFSSPNSSGVIGAAATAVAQIPEQRRLVLEYPETVRVGDHGMVLLAFEVDPTREFSSPPSFQENRVQGGVESPLNLYDTHAIFAEGWLDLDGFEVRPNPLVRSPLRPGREVRFIWDVRSERAGKYRGVVWLHLACRPKGGGEEKRFLLSAQQIEIRALNFLGLSGAAARWIGAVGLVLGFLLNSDALLVILGKLRKNTRPS
ncbi:MAG: hypothetical protein NZ840_00370 [Anaerolineales bacterium]|nr:hypothetical protein [Anaerolineales bacterium]MDW8160492.1 hypothetical protein [Anaerolineales bacterium]